jgi:hypothetical protein
VIHFKPYRYKTTKAAATYVTVQALNVTAKAVFLPNQPPKSNLCLDLVNILMQS